MDGVSRSDGAAFAALKKAELQELADRILYEDPSGIERCVQFFQAETKRLWHGRARAMMARRFKYCTLTPDQIRLLVHSIIGRLLAGDYSEQFRDQLRLALHLDATSILSAARAKRLDSRIYVRRCAEWLLAHRTNSKVT